MPRTTGAREHAPAGGDAGFGRLLVVTDRSDCARAAFAVGREWAELFGAELSVLEVSEAGRGTAGSRSGGATRSAAQGQGPLFARGVTLGARNRRLAEGIAEAARDCRADAIVLGVDRRRTTQRHLGRCLRDQLARTTDLPVLIAPAFAPATEAGRTVPARTTAPALLGPGRQLETSGPASRA